MRFAWPAAVLGLAAGAIVLVRDGSSPPDVVAEATSMRTGRSDASPDSAPTTAEPEPDHRGSGLSIRKIETHSRVEGGQDFVIVFDGPVPDDRITYVRNVENVEAPAIAYRTQEWTPEKPTPLRTCGDTHFGFDPPVVVGQVDVLIPADWFSDPPVTDKIVWERHPEGYQFKTPLCGPHEGYVQFAIWSPASHDPDHIQVYFDGMTRLIVEIRAGNG